MYQLSDNTKEYLTTYFIDLEEMKQGMTEMSLTESISHNFIMQMMPHHEMAIKMCENLLKYTTNISLQKLAKGIIVEQTKSIESMRGILDTCTQLENTVQDVALYQRRFDKDTSVMFCEMEHASIRNKIDCNFIKEMIPHHEGAIEMCKNVRCFEICPQLLPITKSIITMQEAGVVQLKKLCQCECE